MNALAGHQAPNVPVYDNMDINGNHYPQHSVPPMQQDEPIYLGPVHHVPPDPIVVVDESPPMEAPNNMYQQPLYAPEPAKWLNWNPYQVNLNMGSSIKHESSAQLQKFYENYTSAEDNPPPEKREATPKDMTVGLLEHQKVGLGWMRKMEQNGDGGLLADDMGLGKTIQAIALILANRQSSKEVHTTLIVAPASLVNQWYNEINEKVKEHKMKIMIYHGAKKTDSKNALANQDGNREFLNQCWSSLISLSRYNVLFNLIASAAQEIQRTKSSAA